MKGANRFGESRAHPAESYRALAVCCTESRKTVPVVDGLEFTWANRPTAKVNPDKPSRWYNRSYLCFFLGDWSSERKVTSLTYHHIRLNLSTKSKRPAATHTPRKQEKVTSTESQIPAITKKVPRPHISVFGPQSVSVRIWILAAKLI